METRVFAEDGTQFVLEVAASQLQARAEGDLITCRIISVIRSTTKGTSGGKKD